MTRKASQLSAAALLVLLAFGCTDDPTAPDPGPPEPEPEYEGAALAPSAANVNSLAVTITATGYDAARLRLRTAGEPDETTPAYPFANGAAEASALGLLAERDYLIDVFVMTAAGADSVETLAHSTGTLPDWLPQVGAVGTPADGLIGLANPIGGLIVDNQGRVRWYVTSEDPVLNNFMAHPNGEYMIFGTEDDVRSYRVLNERGEELRRIGCVGLETRFHEIRMMPDGDYWALCDDPVPTDLSARGGAADATVVWTTLQHVATDGSLVFEFETKQHFSLDDIDPAQFAGAQSVNMTHGNAVDIDADGNIFLSFRSLNEVTKVNGATGEVIWRLGGLANQLTIDDPTREFERQHGVRVVEPGLIQLLDNGSAAPSRMIRYAIDDQAMTADLVLEYAHPTDAFTLVGGSTDVLPDGSGLVSFGREGLVVEVDESGESSFELTGLEDEYIFRAFRIPSLYASERQAD